MADAQREAQINLKTVADVSGAQETAKELGNVEKATKAVDEASKASGKVTEEVTKKKDGLKSALKGLAFEFPALSRAIGFATNPWTLLSAAMGIAAAKLLAWKAAADEAIAKKAELRSYADTVQSIASSAADFAQQAGDFERGLTKIATAGSTAAGKMKDLNDQIDRHRAMQDTLGNLGKQLAHAQIDRGVAGKQIKAEDAVALKAAVDSEADRQSREREIFALNSQASQAHFAARKTEEEIDTIKGRRPDAKAYGELEQRATLIGKEAATSQTDFEKFAKEARTKIAHLEKTRELIQKHGDPDHGPHQQDMVAFAAMISKVLDDIRKRKDENAKIQAKSKEAQRLFKQATDQVTQLNTEETAATERLMVLRNDIERLETLLKEKEALFKQSAPLAEAIRSTTTRTEVGRIVGEKAKQDAHTAFQQYERFQRGEITGAELMATPYQLNYDVAPETKPGVAPYPQRNPQPPHPAHPPGRTLQRTPQGGNASEAEILKLSALLDQNATSLAAVLQVVGDHGEQVAGTLKTVMDRLRATNERISETQANI
jgi:hypothetical protein